MVLDVPPPIFIGHDLVNIVKCQVIVNFFVVVSCIGQVTSRGMFKQGNRAESHKHANALRVVVLELSEAIVHLCCALGMTDVGDFLNAGVGCDEVKLGRKVVLAHLLKIEIPELLSVDIGVELDMLAAVLVASCVSEPNIVAGSNSDKCGGLVCPVTDESVRAIK